MYEMNEAEIEIVNGGIFSKSLSDSINGAIYGLGAGFATGLAMGGINTKSAGLGFGVAAQGVGALIGAAVGAIEGTIGGFIYGRDDISKWVDGYTSRIAVG